jgi:hypothetical protein
MSPGVANPPFVGRTELLFMVDREEFDFGERRQVMAWFDSLALPPIIIEYLN